MVVAVGLLQDGHRHAEEARCFPHVDAGLHQPGRRSVAQGRPATVILDDALVFSDDDRIESMFDVLMRAGDKVQIIVLTCRKRLFTRLGAAPLEIRKVG